MKTKIISFKGKTKGFTLVEILIAIAVFSIVIGAIYGVFISQQHAYHVQDQIVEMEQNARAATNMMIRELRMAGYHAMGDELINNLASWVPSSFVPTYPLTVNLGEEPTKITLGDGTEPDMITFLAVLDTENNPTTLSSAVTAGATQITLSLNATETGNQYNVNDIIHIGTASEYVKVTAISGSTLTIDTNPTVGGNQGLSESYASGMEVGEISVVSYAVFNEANDSSHTYHDEGHPVLKRNVNGGHFQPIAENITDMQISPLGSGEKPVEIQLTLTARTDKPDPRYSANSGYRTLDMDIRIKIRNAAVATGSSCNLPHAPENLTLDAGLNSTYPCQIHMTWDAVTTDSNGDDLETECAVTGYKVYYDTTSGLYGNSVEPGNVTEHTLDVSALDGCTYYVAVSAQNTGGLSAKSSEQTRTDVVAPAAPTWSSPSTSVSGGDNRVDLSWSANMECDLAGYNLYRSTTSGGSYTQVNISTIGTGSTTFIDTDVKGCQTYYYVISAEDFCPNVSSYSSEVSATPTDTTAPAPPTNLTHSAAGDTDTLNWTASADDGAGTNDVVSYKVYGDGTLLATLAAGTTTYSYTPASPIIVYAVSAVDEYCGNESEIIEVSTCSQVPSVAISSPAADATVTGSVTIQGTASAPGGRTLTSIQVKIGSDAWVDATGTTSWTHTWNTTSYDNGSYTIIVRATDDSGCFETTTINVTVDNPEGVTDSLIVTVYGCQPGGNNKPVYIRVKVTDQNGDPVSGVTVTSNLTLSTDTTVLAENDQESYPGLYGGVQSSICGDLESFGGDTVSGTGLAAKLRDDQPTSVSVQIIAEKDGYVDGVGLISL